MWILSFNIHHNASVTLLKDDAIVLHLEEERITHVKHDKFPLHSLFLIKKYTDVIDYCCFTYLWDFNTDPSVYVKYLQNMCGIKVLNYTIPSPHHHLHAHCAFIHSKFDDAVIVVIDGAGADYDYGKENETIFDARKGSGLKILQQSIFGLPKEKVTNKRNHSIPVPEYVKKNKVIGAGMIYSAVTEWLGWNGLECGKTMGLAPYGEDDKNIKPMLTKSGGLNDRCGIINYHNVDNIGVILKGYTYIEGSDSHWCSDDIKILSGIADYGEEELERRRRNLAYKIQNEYEEYLINLCNKALTLSNSKNLILSGGCALNCVANYKLLKSIPKDINLFVEPLSSDCGVSMGAAFELLEKLNPNSDLKYDNIYLGQELDYRYELLDGELEYDTNPEYVATLLSEGNIVAIAQGRSESGPRALGNRSILFDPRVENGKDIVNKVKKREYFRPFAGTVLFEHMNDWFDMDRLDESPYMMYAVNVFQEKQNLLPAITHVDGTCRVQTLKKEQNKHYYNLISEFYNITGVPVLFNTSFNLAGDTIVETMDDAFRTMRNSEIEYLYLPEIKKLIYFPNK
jgi:carbamoyltransferase